MSVHLPCGLYVYRICSKGGAVDRYKFKINLYKDVRSIFEDLKELGIPMAAASRLVCSC